MDGPKAPNEIEYSNLIQFLNTELRGQENWSITNEYPLAFNEGNRRNIRIITEQNKVISHALVRPLIVKTPVAPFKVAAIGSVVTSSDHRKNGYSTKVIESCLQLAMSQNCELAILWTNLHDFYRRLGFELAGSELSIIFDRQLQLPDSNLKFIEGAKVAPEAIHRLYQQHTVASHRTLDELRQSLKIPNSRIYTAWDTHGLLQAYAIEGKGADLLGYVHEWGGGVPSLLQLFNHIQLQQNKPITIITPKHAQNLIRQCKEHHLAIHEGFLGMVKILDVQKIINKVKRYAKSQGVTDLVLEYQDHKLFIGMRDNILTTDSEGDMARIFFGPLTPSEIQLFSETTRTALAKILPLPLWVWGWDSV